MTDDPLYRREILRLAADATGAGHLAQPDACASVHNPACGDRVTVELTLESGRIIALAHQTQACILTQASAALLASQALTGGPVPAPGYAAFDGVAAHPGRHVCVLLPVEAVLKALEDSEPGSARP